MITNDYVFPRNIEEIDNMTGDEFEEFLSFYFELVEGFKVIKTPKYDKGVDLILYEEKDKQRRIGIQAKRFKTPVKQAHIINMDPAKNLYFLEKSILITTAKLSNASKDEAFNRDIDFFEREYIKQMLDNIEKFYDKREDQMFDNLRKLRRKLAFEHNIDKDKLYYVFNNKTIDDLIEKRPRTIQDLYDVYGLGEEKINKYGKDIINCLK